MEGLSVLRCELVLLKIDQEGLIKNDFDKGGEILLQKYKKMYLDILAILKESISMKAHD